MAVLPNNGSIPAAEQTAAQNGAPSFFAANLLDDLIVTPVGNMGAVPEWRLETSQASGTDITHTAFPTTRIYDRNAHTFSRPAAGSLNGANNVSLHIQLEGSSSRLLDTIAILPNNFADILGPTKLNTTFSLQIDGTDSGNPSFGAAFTSLATIGSISDDTELIEIQLNSWIEYHTVDLLRLTFTLASGTWGTANEPEIALVHFGKRRQLGHFPEERDFDEEPERAIVADFVAESQASKRHIYAEGQGFFNYNYQLGEGGQINIDEIAKVRSFKADSRRGGLNFWYIDQPDVSPIRGHFVRLDDPSFNLRHVGPFERRWRVSMLEQPPFQSLR
jgi:hypothetical protein